MDRRFLRCSLISTAILAGCTTFSPQQVSGMPTYAICETQVNQGANLTDESRRLLQSELQRRNESCTAYVPAINAARAADLYERHNFSP